MNQMNVWGMTDIGLVRKENQDAYVTAQHTASGRTVGVVCDGMGGANAGNVASRFAAQAFAASVKPALQDALDETARQEPSAAAGGIRPGGSPGQSGHSGGGRAPGGMPEHGHYPGVRHLL